jgi:hypothetical protein
MFSLNVSIYASWNTKDLAQPSIDLTVVSPFSGFCILRHFVRILDKERLPRHKARANTGQHEEGVYQEES